MNTLPPNLTRLQRALVLAASSLATIAVLAANLGLAASYQRAGQSARAQAASAGACPVPAGQAAACAGGSATVVALHQVGG